MKCSNESKLLIFAGFSLLFVGVPTIVWQQTPETAYIGIGGAFGLCIVAGIFLIAGLARLHKDGAIYCPDKPNALVPLAALMPILGAVVSFLIIHYTGMLANIALTFWTFLVCSGLGAVAGFYMVGVRVIK